MKDIKIKDAAYFPPPQAIYKALPIPRTMGEAAAEYMAGWTVNGLIILPSASEYMKAWTFNGLIILASAGEYDDGKEWLHVSVSRKRRLPTYEELTRIKRDFIGKDKKAVFVLPEKEKHVNIHNFCLHLVYSAANPLPDFTGGSGSI